jgi:uncharacterized protein with GYD domain
LVERYLAKVEVAGSTPVARSGKGAGQREGVGMPKFMIKASYTPEGARGIAKEGGTSRRDTISKLAQNAGGSMESFYFAFGENDAYVVCEMPDNATAAAVALAVNSSGAAHVQTVVLMTPEEVDEASRTTVDYRPPGK